jgi:DNA polymerase-3 subunit epsilon
MSILDSSVATATVAVVDSETTGLYPRADRLVEISVVRSEPGAQPEVVINTLINPQRPVGATEIHGITDEDVADAPTFADIAGDVANALTGCVVAAYNVYFDIRFLNDEFARVGLKPLPPYLCLMYMRPLLGLGRKCCLSDACKEHGVPHEQAHTAAADALASMGLWNVYRQVMATRGIQTFRELTLLSAYKFLQSFTQPPWRRPIPVPLPSSRGAKPRKPLGSDHVGTQRNERLREYWDAITAAVADLEITPEEIADLAARRLRLGLTTDELRAVHGRVFAAMLTQAIEDTAVTDAEWLQLKRLHGCLGQLGWAPGS